VELRPERQEHPDYRQQYFTESPDSRQHGERLRGPLSLIRPLSVSLSTLKPALLLPAVEPSLAARLRRTTPTRPCSSTTHTISFPAMSAARRSG